MLEILGARSLEALVAETVPAGIRLASPQAAARGPRRATTPCSPCAAWPARTRCCARSSAWATTTASLRPSSSGTSWRTPAGTRSTRPTRPRSRRDDWRRCSTSRPWSPTSPGCPSPTPRCSTRPPPPPRPCTCAHAVDKTGRRGFFVADDCHPQTIAVVQTRAKPLGIERPRGPAEQADFAGQELFGVLVQYPTTDGRIVDYAALVERAHARGRARRRGHRPARPHPAAAARASGAPTSRWARASVSASPWASAVPTPPSWPRGTSTGDRCPAASSASRRTPRAGRPIAWPCRRASSTSAATRPRATSAPPRCCWR